MILPFRLIAFATVMACLAASAARADALQDQVLAGIRAARPDDYAFRRTIAIERTGAPRKLIVQQFDPRKPAAERWTLVSIDGRAPTAKETGDARKRNQEPTPSYNELAKWFGAPAVRSDGPPGTVTYRFARLPDGVVKIGPHDASRDTQAEAVVNATGKVPFVERVRFMSTKGFSIMLVASLKHMAVESRYRLLPDGHAVPGALSSDITGSMLGTSGQVHSSVTYSDFRAVR